MDAGSFIVDVDNFFEGIITSGATAAFNALAVPSASFLAALGAVAFAFFVTVNAMRGSFSLESWTPLKTYLLGVFCDSIFSGGYFDARSRIV